MPTPTLAAKSASSVASPPVSVSGRIWSAGTLTYTGSGVVILFAWLLWGDFAWSMRDRSVMPMAQWYLKSLDVPNLVFGLLISSVPAVFGLILSPIISYKSDRHRGPRGRRIPFLLLTTPISALGMVGLGLCPILGPALHRALGAGSPGEVNATLICFGLFWAAFEFGTIASTAVFGGLINDIVPTELLGRFYGLFRAISLIGGIIFNYWLIGRIDSDYTLLLVALGVFYGVGFLWLCRKVKEGAYPPPQPDELAGRGFISGAGVYFRECFGRSYYAWVFVMVTLSIVAFLPFTTFAIPYARSLDMSMDAYGKCVALTFLISLVLAYPIGWLSDVFHPLRTSIACLIGNVAVSLWGALYARDAHTFAIALVLNGVLAGSYFTSSASLGQRLYPKSKFAQFSSAAGILSSLAYMTLGPLTGSLIDMGGGSYVHTLTASCALSLLALCACWHVHGKFMRLGGPRGYSAPE